MNDITLLPQTSWQRLSAEASGPVFLRKYVHDGQLGRGTLMTMGMYPSAQSAMLAGDEVYWIPFGLHKWQSQCGKWLIEPGSD